MVKGEHGAAQPNHGAMLLLAAGMFGAAPRQRSDGMYAERGLRRLLARWRGISEQRPLGEQDGAEGT